jgi:hypothetical protein
MNTFRDHLQDTLKQQGGILQTVGKGMSGAPSYVRGSILAPELIPVFAGLRAAGVLTGSTGLLESSGGNLLSPSLYKGKKS